MLTGPGKYLKLLTRKSAVNPQYLQPKIIQNKVLHTLSDRDKSIKRETPEMSSICELVLSIPRARSRSGRRDSGASH